MQTTYPTYAVLPSSFSLQYKLPALSSFSADTTLFYYSRASSVDDPVRSHNHQILDKILYSMGHAK